MLSNSMRRRDTRSGHVKGPKAPGPNRIDRDRGAALADTSTDQNCLLSCIEKNVPPVAPTCLRPFAGEKATNWPNTVIPAPLASGGQSEALVITPKIERENVGTKRPTERQCELRPGKPLASIGYIVKCPGRNADRVQYERLKPDPAPGKLQVQSIKTAADVGSSPHRNEPLRPEGDFLPPGAKSECPPGDRPGQFGEALYNIEIVAIGCRFPEWPTIALGMAQLYEQPQWPVSPQIGMEQYPVHQGTVAGGIEREARCRVRLAAQSQLAAKCQCRPIASDTKALEPIPARCRWMARAKRAPILVLSQRLYLGPPKRHLCAGCRKSNQQSHSRNRTNTSARNGASIAVKPNAAPACAPTRHPAVKLPSRIAEPRAARAPSEVGFAK